MAFWPKDLERIEAAIFAAIDNAREWPLPQFGTPERMSPAAQQALKAVARETYDRFMQRVDAIARDEAELAARKAHPYAENRGITPR